MGLASSIGLGVALSSSKKTVVIDGDGSILMNLGSLATIGANQPKNYCLFIIDNGSYGSTGFQPTFTSENVSLYNISKSCGIKKTFLCKNRTDCEDVIPKAVKNNEGPFCVIIKTLEGNPDDIAIIPYDSEFIKKRFMECLCEKER
jgi:sulfopyruvate decarboxylase subunit beta